MTRKIFTTISIIFICSTLKGQSKKYRLKSIVFYNVENLYDTKNDSITLDDARTPEGRYKWTIDKYQLKLDRIAKVIASITEETSKTTPDIVGLAEIENIQVLKDLTNNKVLIKSSYAIVHEDSPDERGIDVAMLYKKKSFIPGNIQFRRLLIYNKDGYRDYTRDQLVVDGYIDGELFCFIVNHWPSRSGGEVRSKPFREAAALLNKKIIDSVVRKHPDIKIISMGDFNDNPTDDSFKKILRTKGKRKNIATKDLYNPMEKLYKMGLGSLAYRDRWSLFDQFYVTSNLLQKNNGFLFWKTGIYDPEYLKTKTGKYKGYPWRTFSAGIYTKGYADHFPIYLFLVKEEKSDN